jgi:hypothetical protein
MWEVDMRFNIVPETFQEVTQAGFPATLIIALLSMELDTIDKSNAAIFGLHRDFKAMG